MLRAIRTRNLFPHTIATVQTPEPALRNVAFRDIMLQRRRTTPTLHASNDGGWHSDRDLRSWGWRPHGRHR